MTTMITFNELRQIKDMLPSGSMQKIADELGLDVETVRNYFGGGQGCRFTYRARSEWGHSKIRRYYDPGKSQRNA